MLITLQCRCVGPAISDNQHIHTATDKLLKYGNEFALIENDFNDNMLSIVEHFL